MYIVRNEAATSLQCARQCKRTTGCFSVFYSHDDRICQLHPIAIDIDGYTGEAENVLSGEYLLLSQGSGGNKYVYIVLTCPCKFFCLIKD